MVSPHGGSITNVIIWVNVEGIQVIDYVVFAKVCPMLMYIIMKYWFEVTFGGTIRVIKEQCEL